MALRLNTRKLLFPPQLGDSHLHTSKWLCRGFTDIDSSLSIFCIRVSNGKAIKSLS